MTSPQTFAGLSLEKLAETIASSAYLAFSTALGAPAHTNAFKFFEWCTAPQVGQLVVELSMRGRMPAINRLGILLSVTDTPYEDWDVEIDGPASTRKVYRLMRLNGETIDWEDCRFIAVRQNEDLTRWPKS